jgi:hypothetical protein
MVFRQGDIEGHPMQPAWDQISEEEQELTAHGAFSEADYWEREEIEREQTLKLQELEQELDSE